MSGGEPGTAGPRLDPEARRNMARVTGGLYVAYIVATILATMFGQIGMGSDQQVFQAITANEGSFRLALFFVLASGLLFLLAAWGLYVLLRPVNPDLALLFLLLNAVGVAIQGASMLGLIGAMTAQQTETQALVFINVYKLGFLTAQVFFGAWLFPLGYLVYKSSFLPRLLGVLLLLDGIAVLIWLIQGLLLPDYPALRYPGLALSFIAEVGLALWLLFMGIKTDATQAQPSGMVEGRAAA